MTKLEIITVLLALVKGPQFPISDDTVAGFLAIIGIYIEDLSGLTSEQITDVGNTLATANGSIFNDDVSLDDAVSAAQTAVPEASEFVEAVIRSGAI